MRATPSSVRLHQPQSGPLDVPEGVGAPSFKILFALSMQLGWRTNTHRLQQAISKRVDLQPDFITFDAKDLDLALRALCRVIGIGKSRRYLVHPIIRNRYWVRQFARRRRFVREYDGIFVAPHALAREFLDIFPNDVPLFVQMDTTMPQNERESGSWYKNSQALAWERDIFNRANHIFSMTNWAAQSLQSEYGIAQSKISVTMPGSLLPEVFQSHSDAKEMLTIGFVGNPFGRKGGNDLLTVHQDQLSDRARLHIVSKDFT